MRLSERRASLKGAEIAQAQFTNMDVEQRLSMAFCSFFFCPVCAGLSVLLVCAYFIVAAVVVVDILAGFCTACL